MEENAVIAKPKQWGMQIQEFRKDTVSEMKKVTWPSRQEVINTTVVVVVATLIFAIYLWSCDQVFAFLTLKLFSSFGANV